MLGLPLYLAVPAVITAYFIVVGVPAYTLCRAAQMGDRIQREVRGLR